MDLFKDIQSRIKMMETPEHLNKFHLIGLVHFAAEAAEELQTINCDGTHALWNKFATTPLLKNLIRKNCRHQSTVCCSLLSLPNNPLTPVVLNSFDEEDGAFSLVRIFQNLITEKISPQQLDDVYNKIQEISNSLPLMSQHQIALRTMEIAHGSPVVNPALTLTSFQNVKTLKVKLNENWERDFMASLIVKLTQNLMQNPQETKSATEYYVHNLPTSFKDALYTSLIDTLHWRLQNEHENSLEAVAKIVNKLPQFNQWLCALKTPEDRKYIHVKDLLVSHYQKELLAAVVGEKPILKIKKM